MKTFSCAALTASALTATALAAFAGPATAAGRLADISVIDRDSGARLPAYFHAGEYWIAGRPGQRYLVQLCNRLPGRALAVVSVDGVNVLDGDTAGVDQPGYVYAPGECGTVDGWRKSQSQVAAFEFSAVADSYAARTGRAANVGVIGIAVFSERISRREYAANGAQPPIADLASAAPATPAARAAESARQDLGTGHGSREYSWVDYTTFTRASDRPDEIVRIRYGSEAQLVALGVIRRPRPAIEAPDPFPASPLARFVPDPR